MLKPLADHVIVEVVEVEEKTASGIFLPDTAVKKTATGQGSGCRQRQIQRQRHSD